MNAKNHLMIERIRHEMERVGMNARKLAEEARVGRSFVYDILSGKSLNPTSQKLVAIAEALGVSLPYLVSGVTNDNDMKTVTGGAFFAVPSVETADICAGYKEKVILASGEPYFFKKIWIKEILGSNPEHMRVVHMTDNSMVPAFGKGDMLLVDIKRVQPSPAGVFLIHDGVGIIPRRLEVIPGKEPARLRIQPDNPGYATHEALLAEVQVMGRVVWCSKVL